MQSSFQHILSLKHLASFLPSLMFAGLNVCWFQFSFAVNTGSFLAVFFSAHSFAKTPGFFLAICFDVCWFQFSFAVNTGSFLAVFFSAHSFAKTPDFFLAICFDVCWFQFSFALKAGFCLYFFLYTVFYPVRRFRFLSFEVFFDMHMPPTLLCTFFACRTF